MDRAGLEPATSRVRGGHSTAELPALTMLNHYVLKSLKVKDDDFNMALKLTNKRCTTNSISKPQLFFIECLSSYLPLPLSPFLLTPLSDISFVYHLYSVEAQLV